MPTPKRVIELTSGNDDYTRCFISALRATGTHVIDGDWSGKWILRNVQRDDVVHLHWPSFLYHDKRSVLKSALKLLKMMALLTAIRRRGAHIAWTAHNLYPHDGGKSFLPHRIARRFVIAIASVVGVHGEEAKKHLLKEFRISEEKLVRLQHGNWIGYYPNTIGKDEARARLGIPTAAFLLSFVGLCKPYKNIEGLCQAFASLPDHCHLIIAGRFPDQAYLEKIASMVGKAQNVKLDNRFIPSEELQIYLNACDAVVLPYKEILTSGTVMLALSFGRPVVASGFGFLREVVTEDCGELFDPSQPETMQQALMRAKSRVYDSKKILERAQSYNWTDSAQAFKEKIDSL